MKKSIILLGLLLLGTASKAQTYNFNNNPVGGGWTVVNSNNSNGAGISWTGTALQYDLQSADLADVGVQKYFYRRSTPLLLDDQFSVSFKIRQENGSQNNSIKRINRSKRSSVEVECGQRDTR
jgi:hypothetical protein